MTLLKSILIRAPESDRPSGALLTLQCLSKLSRSFPPLQPCARIPTARIRPWWTPQGAARTMTLGTSAWTRLSHWLPRCVRFLPLTRRRRAPLPGSSYWHGASVLTVDHARPVLKQSLPISDRSVHAVLLCPSRMRRLGGQGEVLGRLGQKLFC